MEILDHSGAGRARVRELAGRQLPARRRHDLDARNFRSRNQHRVLGHQQSAPDFDGEARPGDNLYTDCVLALDADTGKLRWYFQFTPHDLYDYDAEETPVLIDAMWQGQPRKLLVEANRNGFLYVLDRTDGKFLSAVRFVEKMNWAKGIDEHGRPIRSGAAAHGQRHAGLPGIQRRNQLVFAIIQSVDQSLLFPGVGKLRISSWSARRNLRPGKPIIRRAPGAAPVTARRKFCWLSNWARTNPGGPIRKWAAANRAAAP